MLLLRFFLPLSRHRLLLWLLMALAPLPFLQECLFPALPLDLVDPAVPSLPEPNRREFQVRIRESWVFLPVLTFSPAAPSSPGMPAMPAGPSGPGSPWKTTGDSQRSAGSKGFGQVWLSHLRSWLAHTSRSLWSRLSRETLITLERKSFLKYLIELPV